MRKILLLLLLFVGSFGYSQTSNDADAQAFITALNADPSGVKLTTAEMNYITQMVEGMKSIGVWSKMVACYPIVGGNDFKHKFNLKNPLDVDGAFRLDFLGGGWTHSSLGADPNGTTSYANTFLNPAIQLTSTSTHLSHCTNENTAVSDGDFEIGAQDASNNFFSLTTRRTSNTIAYGSANSTVNDFFLSLSSNAIGFTLGNFSSSTLMMYKNSVQVVPTQLVSLGTTLPSFNLYLSALNNVGSTVTGFSNKRTTFASIGSGLTDSEAQRLSHLIYYCQGILQRQ